MRYISSLFLVLFVILFSFCTPKSSPVGSSQLIRDNAGSESYSLFRAAANDTFFHVPVLTRSGTYLYFGNDGNTEAVTFLKFTGIPDSVTYDSAIVQIVMNQKLSSDNNQWSFKVHRVNDSWDETSKTWDDIENGYIGDELGFVDFIADTVDTVRFHLDPDLITAWADTNLADQNYGIALVASGSGDNMYEIYSRHSGYSAFMPYVIVYGSTPDDTADYTRIFHADEDIYVAKSDKTPTSDKITIQNSTSYRSYLYFDVSSIPTGSAINNATIILHADTIDAYPNNKNIFNVDVVGLAQKPTDFDYVEIDSSVGDYGIMYADSIYMKITVTDLLQVWQGDSTQNNGFLIMGSDRYSDLTSRSFYSTRADSALQPELKVYYNTLPSGRF